MKAGLTCGAVVFTFVGSAMAEDASTTSRRAVEARERGNPYTMVEASVGVFALPAAEVCPTSLDECETGEISLALGLHNIYQIGDFGFGAGIMWATTLRNDSARGAPELERDHARRYFLVEGLFRYTLFQADVSEWWVGATVGGAFLNDSWTVKSDREPESEVEFIGPKAATIGTEGVSVGIAGGGTWIFAENLSLGGTLRYANWFLPPQPEVSPTGDVASLSGRLDMIELSLAIAYRLAL